MSSNTGSSRMKLSSLGRSLLTAIAARTNSKYVPSQTVLRCLATKSDEAVWKKFPDGSRFWKPLGDKHSGRYQRPIFVAATRQHVGKTTTSLALLAGLKKRYDKLGFLKPVGQQHVEVKSESLNKMIRVDKDVCLVREHFRLDHIDYEHMSPVIIPKGYTKKYVDGEISSQQQMQDVLKSMENISSRSDVVLCEGTGHCAVGSIVGLNNAQVASVIGADMVLVVNGGLGSAFDELELNRILCQHYGVRIAGVIVSEPSLNELYSMGVDGTSV